MRCIDCRHYSFVRADPDLNLFKDCATCEDYSNFEELHYNCVGCKYNIADKYFHRCKRCTSYELYEKE